ncbi:MAG: IS21 family transposase [Chlamydiia bacterium]
MEAPAIVNEILRLHADGKGSRTIATEVGVSRDVVRKYIRQGGWRPYAAPERKGRLDHLSEWLESSLRKNRGNADVVRQDLEQIHGIKASLRMVERSVEPFRKSLAAETIATVRFETPPGKQLQIDFGSTHVMIGKKRTKIFLFVATLGYSRRGYVRVFLHERQSAWFEGLEGAFHHFGGIPREVLMDNARALVVLHNRQTGELVFNPRLSAFAAYWRFTPKACAPYRARTKGKDENGVNYVKRNAIAGHSFDSVEALEGHLSWWMREVSDQRVHGTTGERPVERFQRDETGLLTPLDGRPPFEFGKELRRMVHGDACIELDTNSYSVPWRLIRQEVLVQVSDSEVRIFHGESEVARHALNHGRRQRVEDWHHLQGIAGGPSGDGVLRPLDDIGMLIASELLRPLAEYEAVAGGRWS